ncbi:hypothetical protein FRC01_007945 [Tulasnella sp. 417]|nr:hypothetical protein FRC01_007945 [Tulasnella sp. 417]
MQCRSKQKAKNTSDINSHPIVSRAVKEEAIEQALSFESPTTLGNNNDASGPCTVSVHRDQSSVSGVYQELKDSHWRTWRGASGETRNRFTSVHNEDTSEPELDGGISEPEVICKTPSKAFSVNLDGWKLGEADPSENRLPPQTRGGYPHPNIDLVHIQTTAHHSSNSGELCEEEWREIEDDREADLPIDTTLRSDAETYGGGVNAADLAGDVLDKDYTSEDQEDAVEAELLGEEATIDGIFWEERTVGGHQQRVRVKRCESCRQTISLGHGTGIHSLIEHQGSRACRAAAAQILHEEQSRQSQPKLTDLWQSARQRQARSTATIADSPVVDDTSHEKADIASGERSWSRGQVPVGFREERVAEDGRSPERLATGIGGNKNTVSQCSGIPISFTNSIYRDYPFHLHHYEDMPYFISRVENKGKDFWIQSHKCLGIPRLEDTACTMCKHLDVSNTLDGIQKRSIGTINPHLNYRYRTFPQITEALQEKTRALNKSKLEALNLSRKLGSLTGRVSDYKQVMQHIAFLDVPGVQRVIRVALRNGRSPSEIVGLLEKASKGLYHAKGFKTMEIDIAALSLVIGGPKLVYALSRSLALPSLTALRKHSRPPVITPSPGFPKREEIVSNINNCFQFKLYGKPRGFEVMMDELSLEERPRYHYATNAVLGICREHGGTFDLEVSSMDPLYALAEGLRNKEVHYSKESTVVAIAPLTGDDYGALIIMISGTCKTETDLHQSRWIELVESGWSDAEHGGIRHGELWSFSSDGDPTRRRSMHRVFMNKDLAHTSPIHRLLSPLKLMNLRVGINSITSNFDTKHIFKRYATLIHGTEGILLSHSHVQCAEIKKYLHLHPRFQDSSTTIASLFDGKDHQNVPKAVQLLAAVSSIREIPLLTEQPEAHPLILLGHLLDSLLLPFVTAELSLSEQLTHLSTAAHLIFALYRLDGNAFMPGQLYYDTQACVKNIYFCVAMLEYAFEHCLV